MLAITLCRSYKNVKVVGLLARYKHFAVLLLLVPVLVWFKLLEAFLVPKYNIHIPLDDMVPLMPVFVIPYLFWFIYIAIGIIYTGLHSKREFYKLVAFLGVGMSLAYITYMIFPNEQTMRPEVHGNGVFSWILTIIYATDTPTNVCPSVHVINAMAVDAAMRHTEPFSKRRINRVVSFIIFILICVSTVCVKQHSVFDVICGLLYGGLVYIPLYKLDIFSKRDNEPALTQHG
jgi:membrane-associated phospholipid phosphatase